MEHQSVELNFRRTARMLAVAGAGILALSAAAGLRAQPATEVELELVLSGLSTPLDLKSAGDSRLFAVGQGGVIQVIHFDGTGNATLDPTPFLNISTLISGGGERGLLGLAFHPDYLDNGYFYVNYTCLAAQQAECAADGDTIIARHSVSADPDVAVPGPGLVLATIPQDASNHNGGGLQFEPFPDPDDDRTLLYISMGDGGGSNDPNENAQNLASLKGKLLRVDVDNLDGSLPRWSIPADNPELGGNISEIWAWGLRNPWRFSFDQLNGDLWIADVGQNNREEVNLQSAASAGGENYGWRQCEGTRVNFADEAPGAPEFCFGGAGLIPPVLEYAHSGTSCNSITGGYVYRGAEFAAELGGTYFYADYCTGQLWGARNDGSGWSNIIDQATGLAFDIASFGERHNGELYIATLPGQLLRIRPLAAPAPADLVVSALSGPRYGFLGSVISVDTAQVRNQGGSGAGSSDLGYYFSTDPANQPAQHDSGSACVVPALAADATYSCEDVLVNVPAGLSAGNYHLVAIADHDGNVAEADETNNDRADAQSIELVDCSIPGAELCFDGVDNDCDGFVDGADSECLPACLPQGAACSGNFECCSQKCRGGANATCKGDPVCTPSENPEQSCSDGQDNDCDGLVDDNDPDCPSSCVPTQLPAETSCSDGLDNDCDSFTDGADDDCALSCSAKGDACSVDADCCSNRCRGAGSSKSCK